MAAIASTPPGGKRSVNIYETSGRASLRRAVNWLMTGLIVAGALIGCGILFVILGYIIVRGAPALNWAFFTQRPAPLGQTGGGVAPAILGTLTMVGIGALIGIPVGVGSGIYLAEFGRGRFADTVRFVADLMTGLPSIAIGAFAWAILVRRVFNSYNPIAGGVALSIIMIPIITRTVEEILKLVPNNLREASLALGTPGWKTVMQVVLPVARGGIVTGVVLSIARAAGERVLQLQAQRADGVPPDANLQLRQVALHRLAYQGVGQLARPDHRDRLAEPVDPALDAADQAGPVGACWPGLRRGPPRRLRGDSTGSSGGLDELGGFDGFDG
jgi:phosphate transport system permease protein